jgi:hypothetical protein
LHNNLLFEKKKLKDNFFLFKVCLTSILQKTCKKKGEKNERNLLVLTVGQFYW